MGNPSKFTKEFKKDAVAYYQAHKREITLVQAAKNLGVSLSALGRWIKNSDLSGGDAAVVTPKVKGVGDLEAENRRLKTENARLKEEREILKKAAAFFANEEAGQRK